MQYRIRISFNVKFTDEIFCAMVLQNTLLYNATLHLFPQELDTRLTTTCTSRNEGMQSGDFGVGLIHLESAVWDRV